MTAAWGLGQMVGPTLAGVLYDSLGSYVVPSLLAAAALVVAATLASGALSAHTLLIGAWVRCRSAR